VCVFNDLSDFPPGYGNNMLVMLVKMLHYVDLYKRVISNDEWITCVTSQIVRP
jgi:hypothetical protein